MNISDKRVVRDFIALLESAAVKHVVLTPGSRNAPFSISLNDHPEIQTHSVVDERSAAFIALGMAQQLGAPVVLICTSGTAALNFAPAIAEAFYQRVPLLIVTADRPFEWIDQGEGQSIRQREVFRNYVKASFEIAEEATEGDQVWYNVRIMDEAMRLCTEGVAGPVHLNFPLREPLYKTVPYEKVTIKRVEAAHTQWHLTDGEQIELSQVIAASSKVMVLAGQFLPHATLLEELVTFSAHPNAAVFTEAHSNMAHPRFVTTIDRMVMAMNDEAKQALVPDLLLTFGHNIISRKIKDYIRKGQCQHWHIDISGEGLDTLKHLTKVIRLHPAEFFRSMNERLVNSSIKTDYASQVAQMNDATATAAQQYLASAPWSDLTSIVHIHRAVPSGTDIQMGNSSAVRYLLLDDARNDIRYFGNRGVAGIDGCTSTALGAAALSGRLTTLITGEIGFFYDSNAFWNNQPKEQLKVVVINNGGGGIFRIIDGPPTTGSALEKYFETAHQRSARGLAAMYELPYQRADSLESLGQGLHWLYSTQGAAILEVMTPRLENAPVLKAYFAAIGAQVFGG